MGIIVRVYEAADARAVGILIADTYRKYNLGFASADEQIMLLGPFANAHSDAPEDLAMVAQTIQAKMAYVAVDGCDVVGVLRGRPGRLHSLFVREDYHRRGVGRMLVERFEAACRECGATQITLASSLYAVPFYLSVGYKRSTGVRDSRSFGAPGLRIQPLRKVLKPASATPTGMHAAQDVSAGRPR